MNEYNIFKRQLKELEISEECAQQYALDAKNKVIELERRLKEAEEVISFYSDKKHTEWVQTSYISIELFSGKKAREYQYKWNNE